MNRTLLLILCDFLLLTILAHTRWDKPEQSSPRPGASSPVVASASAAQDQDLVAAMKLSLEDERAAREQERAARQQEAAAREQEKAAREQLARQLMSAQTDLQRREENLARLAAQKDLLESSLQETRRNIDDISRKYAESTREASLSKEQLAQIQKDLDARQEEARRQQQALAALEQEKAAARKEAENLSVAVQVAEVEKSILRETLNERLQRESEKQQKAQAELAQQVAAARREVESLNTAVQVAEAEKALLQTSLTEQLKREIEERKAEAEKRQQALLELEKQKAAVEQRVASLNTAIQVAEAEKNLLRENLTEVKGEVEVVRQEKAKIQEQNMALASNVGKLAATSGELAGEIRENRPINANTLFTEFMENRVQVKFHATRSGLFGPAHRTSDSRSVLVADGNNVHALQHIDDTPFRFEEPAINWGRITGMVARGFNTTGFSSMSFLAADPRVVIIPVSADQAKQLGVKIYPTTRNPFKFTEAVLVSNGGKYYGETEFKIDPKNPQYVKMKSRFIDRIFGEFSPSTGDLVFSKTGELLGVMVNGEYCVVLGNFLPARTIKFGDNLAHDKTAPKLEEMNFRISLLPFGLQ